MTARKAKATATVAQKVDPYWLWGNASNFVDHNLRSDGRYAVLIECLGADQLSSLAKRLGREGQINEAYLSPDLRYCTAVVSRKGYAFLLNDSAVSRVEFAQSHVCGRARSKRRTRAYVSSGAASAPSSATTLLAVIDDGCPFAHRKLLSPNSGRGTRVRTIWDQNSAADFDGISSTPKDFGYGAEVDRGALNACIANATSSGRTDEDCCYRIAGYTAVRRVKSHGAHSIGIALRAAGNEPACADTDILFVQLPRDILDVPSNAAMCRHILDGIQWVLARRRKRETSVVVSIGYVTPLGSHDGASIFEKAVDALIERSAKKGINLTVVLAAGNDYETRQHAYVPEIRAGESVELTIGLMPSGELSTFVELWLPSSAAHATISLTPPNAPTAVVEVQAGELSAWPAHQNAQCAVVFSDWQGADGARLALVRFAPTHSVGAAVAVASVGTWTLSIRASSTPVTAFHAWISRAHGSIGTLLRGHQAKFSGVQVEQTCTLSGMACGLGVTVVGAYRAWDRTPAKYTASGPSRSKARTGPDFSAPGDESITQFGIRSIGNRSGESFRMRGTSVATPYVAGCSMITAPAGSPNTHPRLGTMLP